MCCEEKGLEAVESHCGCSPRPNNEERLNRIEEIARLKERKHRLEQEITEVDQKMENIKV